MNFSILFLVLTQFLSFNASQNVYHTFFSNNIDKFNLSSVCRSQLQIFVDSLEHFEEKNAWAWESMHISKHTIIKINHDGNPIPVLDATAKLQSGILTGNTADLGNFDECLGIQVDTEIGEIFGKYCLASIVFDSSDGIRKIHDSRIIEAENVVPSFKWAACFPNGCTSEEMFDVYAKLFENYFLNLTGLKIQFPEKLCQIKNDYEEAISTESIIGLIIFSTILIMIIASTVYEVYIHKLKEPKHVIFVAFSIYGNGKKLFKINNSDSQQLSCLNGLRVISMLWILIAHQYDSMTETAVVNGFSMLKWSESFHSMYIFGATVAVDTFFFLGGLLIAYSFFKSVSQGIPFNIFLYWFHRYLRLTPALAAVVLMNATIVKYVGSGPFWSDFVEDQVEPCRKYWWSTLLYVQNYVNLGDFCIGQSWYLSIDMQLFIISPAILIPLWKWRKTGIILLCVWILTSIAIPFYISWQNNLYSEINISNLKIGDYWYKYYLVTHTRAAPWLIGIFVGYYIFHIKKDNKTFKFNKIALIILWCTSLSVMYFCVFGGHDTLKYGEYNKWAHISHIVFLRPSWAIALSWLVFACIIGYGGFINWLLSFPVYQVLARLTYSIYLLHLTILLAKVFTSRLPYYFSDFENLYLASGLLIFTTMLSIIWVLAFESPFINIEKVLFSGADKKKINI